MIISGLWGIVNNAGVLGIDGPTQTIPRQEYINVFQVNVFGMVDVTRAFLSLVKKSKGRVVNMSSMVGLLIVPTNAPYGMSKHSVEAFSDSLRLAWDSYLQNVR